MKAQGQQEISGLRASAVRPGAPEWLRAGRRIAVALVVCLALAAPALLRAAGPNSAESAPLTMMDKAPDFVLKDLNGQAFRLSDHRGKRPVLIIFSTTWCSFCQAEIPHFKSIHATYAKQGLEIVNIDIQESRQKVAAFTAKNALPYRVLLDESGTVSDFYGVRGVPTLTLVDRNGMIVCRQCQDVDPLLKSVMKK